MQFEFATATRIIFGAGVLGQVGPLVKPSGRRALVVTGSQPQRAEKLLANLAANGISTATFAVAGEPDLSTVENGTAFAQQHNCDCVIALGGGSVMDAGKAIAAMLTNDGELSDYLEIIGRGKTLVHPPAAFFAIPTTAGSGSEVTRNAVLASPEHKLKVSLRSPRMLATAALIDPELTYDLPQAVTASTGLDALTQLIEPYVCLRANPMTDGLCLEGLTRAARSLRAVFNNGHDKAAREDMAVASLHGGLALANAGLGAVHGFAGVLGGMFAAPHGAVCAALLPHVMTTNIQALREREPEGAALKRYRRIACLLTADPDAAADAGVAWVRQLVADLRIPPLRGYGITPEHVATVVARAANASSMKANPIALTPEELTSTLRQAL